MGCGSSNTSKVVQTTQQSMHPFFTMENKKQLKDNYIIKNKLGEGLYGIVRRVIDKNTGEEKAVKIIPKKKVQKDIENKLVQEINVMKQLIHPSIIKFYEYYQDKKNYYILTELVKGGELFEKISSLTHFSEKEAAFVFSQIISVVQFSHEQHIMHRDLKPENILIEYKESQKDTQYSIKVIDWGAAKVFSAGKRETEHAGTPYYVSPEVLKKNYDEKCDLWSCGVILYIMLTGEPPFYGIENDLSKRILSVKYDMDQDSWKNVSAECKDLVKKLICTEDKRLNASEVQNHPWIKQNLEAFKKKDKETIEEKEQNVLSLTKLKKFTQQNKLQVETLAFIASMLSSKQDREEFKEIFQNIDKNNDGSLSKEEITQGFEQYKTSFHGDYNVDQIFESIDLDKNGKINFEEFIAASIQQDQKYLSKKLKDAFNAFDLDGNGQVNKDELAIIFGKENNDDNEILKILKQYDSNHDNLISLDEFYETILALSKKQ